MLDRHVRINNKNSTAFLLMKRKLKLQSLTFEPCNSLCFGFFGWGGFG
uniref:Uncharacterized protein n=1 Tax=Anguilla anguilla TaxID=7936 RepID=A0A0E9VNP4_ANGAN